MASRPPVETRMHQVASAGMRRKRFDITAVVGYAVSAITTTVGIILLTDFLLPEGVPVRFRIMFGIVLLMMGIYRFTLTRRKAAEFQKLDE